MSENFYQEVLKIKENLRTIFPATPLQHSKYLSHKYGADIWLKREDLTPVRSYKIRGAFNLIGKHRDKNIKLVCSSAGNHAQGFAYLCNFWKIPGIIFMPNTTPLQKIEKTKILGEKFVEIRLKGDNFDEANNAAQEFLSENKEYILVPPFDHEDIIAGQATIIAEIEEQKTSDFDYFIVPVGGGGLSAGITKFSQSVENFPGKIILTEPAGAPSLSKSLKAGKRVELEKIDTFVDGAAVKMIGKVNFDILKDSVKSVILCPENSICETIDDFLFHEGIVLEPAGALSIDALKYLPDNFRGKKIVCILSGGNLDFDRLPEIRERKMNYQGLKKYLILRMPQRPGALQEFLSYLGPNDDICRFEYLKKYAKNNGSVLIGIETSDPVNFQQLFINLKENGFQFKDVTDNDLLSDFLI